MVTFRIPTFWFNLGFTISPINTEKLDSIVSTPISFMKPKLHHLRDLMGHRTAQPRTPSRNRPCSLLGRAQRPMVRPEQDICSVKPAQMVTHLRSNGDFFWFEISKGCHGSDWIRYPEWREYGGSLNALGTNKCYCFITLNIGKLINNYLAHWKTAVGFHRR